MTCNIVVFTASPNYSVVKGIVEIERGWAGLSWLVLVHRPRKSLRLLMRNQWRNLRRNGWRWIVYQTQDIWTRLREALDNGGAASRHAGSKPTQALRALGNVRVLEVSDIHSPASIDAVKAFSPDLGLSLAAPILRKSLFGIPRLGTLNLHKGKLPDYRGMPPAFWELWNDENHVGCSIHWVDERLDTGGIVREARIDRQRYSSVRGLQLLLDEVGIGLLREAVGDVLHGTPTRRDQPAGGATYRKPTLAQVAALERKLQLAHGADRSLRNRFVKGVLPRLAFVASGFVRNGLLKPRITVLLYHRVTDATRDNLTVGIEQFDRQMELVRKHCHVLSLDEVLRTRPIPRSKKPLVAITFDDGYLDNYEHAVPILLRHEIPAAFFVSTGIVAAGGSFPHDLARGNPPIPTMNWAQLRQMYRDGFLIGSHTVNHTDCAAAPQDVVWNELVASRDDLRRELGIEEPVFAYPYGGRENMTPERLALVKQAGYRGCLSAYGGSNIGAIDRYNVVRRGIHWEFPDQAFLFACTGLR
jgi:peptidoglycan/xylan/chitin deacetylase (PgdA/CDA1 family)